MGWFQNMVMKILRIQPAPENKSFIIREPFSYRTSVLRNRLWYRGDPSELEQFYKQSVTDNVSRSRFWAAVPSENRHIRKVHSGLPAMIVERLSDIVVSDMDQIELATPNQTKLWEEIAKDNNFDELLGSSLIEALVEGDGAFKVTLDTDITPYPIIEFYAGDKVQYRRERGRLQEIIYYTEYRHNDKDYQLEETFGKGKITYKLLSADGKEVSLATVPELAGLDETTFTGDFIWGVPLSVFKSSKWPDRGKSIYESKADSFDALDEVISQWWDAIRSGRVQKYIPEDLLPRDPNNGMPIKPNPFDMDFIAAGRTMAEDTKDQISLVQPAILYEAFVSSYASALDMCLQGIVSPSTLGIDLKKTDNAEAQREKEKATLYTRGKIIERLNEVIPELVSIVLKVHDNNQQRTPGDYEASVKFGEYASPSFDAVVETVGKARTFGVMSVERAVEEMYGDTWTDAEKTEEVKRLKDEQSITFDEPSLKRDDPPDPEDDDNEDDET
ncbi:capsid protein [Paenibacillus amylolyticus]|uniref:capsid protein n=1 Tax=Paenibacillus amylolyticus TaxID=1451 RepID=UPI00096C9DB5|nr:capsid protein [Paenibacillus amylolyticus]OMF04029.1 capsid protein [Paenibacillus amylolyticus]